MMTNFEIPFSVPNISDDDIDAVTKVLRSGWITTGPECGRLENGLQDYLGIPHVVAVSSCTAALEIAAAALLLPAGASVGVPTWTFASTALAVMRSGARPVLLDVDSESLNLSPGSLEAAANEGLAAVVGVHFGGVPLPKRVHELCSHFGLPLIEDAAHALGASDHRGLVAGRGTAGAAFSFYATKNLTCAEGGALATDNAELARFARCYRLHGLDNDAWRRYSPEGHPQYELLTGGIKANLPDVLAALAMSQLLRFEEMQRARDRIVAHYREQLSTIPGISVIPPECAMGAANHLLVIKVAAGIDRDGVASALHAKGIGTSVHFRPLHQFPFFQAHTAPGPGGVPIAESLSRRVLSLPLYPTLELDKVDRVCAELRRAVSG